MPFTEKTRKPASTTRTSSANTLFRKPGEGFFDQSQNSFFRSQTGNTVQRKEGDDPGGTPKKTQPPVQSQVQYYNTPMSFKDLQQQMRPQADHTRVAPPLVYDFKPEGKLKPVHSSTAGKAVQFLGGEPYKYIIHYRPKDGNDNIVKVETIYSLTHMPAPSVWSIPTVQPKVVQFVKEDQQGKEISHTGEIPLKNFGSTLYVGPWNPKYTEKDGKDDKGKPLAGKDRYDYPAINSLDAAAKKHDKAYDLVKAVGATSAIADLNTIGADRQLVKDAANVVAMYGLGKTDPVNHQKISLETYEAALKVVKLFTTIVIEKEARIAATKAKDKTGELWDKYVAQPFHDNVTQPFRDNVVKPIANFQENGWRMFVQ